MSLTGKYDHCKVVIDWLIALIEKKLCVLFVCMQFTEECLQLALTYCSSSHQFQVRVWALYMLYALYFKHPFYLRVKVFHCDIGSLLCRQFVLFLSLAEAHCCQIELTVWMDGCVIKKISNRFFTSWCLMNCSWSECYMYVDYDRSLCPSHCHLRLVQWYR